MSKKKLYLFYFCLLLIIIEIILRLLLGNLALAKFELKPADGRKFSLKPNTSTIYTGYFRKISPVVHEVNAQGFRGKNRGYKKAEGIFRIALLGDSFVYGQGLPKSETIAAHLENNLNKQHKKKFEVLNFGVPGYNIEDSFLQYSNFASNWQPDLTVFFIFSNDLKISLYDALKKNPFLFFLQKNIYITRLLFKNFLLLPELTVNKKEYTRSMLRKMNLFCKKNRSKFAVVIIDTPLETQKELIEILKREKIPYLDITRIRKEEKYIIKKEEHFNEKGSREVAKKLEPWLMKIEKR